jgi:hypothetical protein
MNKLVLINEGGNEVEIELKSGTTTVGRSENNSVAIDDEMISDRHCELILAGQDVQVRDLQSTNGTFIDERRVIDETLRPGRFCGLAMPCSVWKLKQTRRTRSARPHNLCFWKMFRNSPSRKNICRC